MLGGLTLFGGRQDQWTSSESSLKVMRLLGCKTALVKTSYCSWLSSKPRPSFWAAVSAVDNVPGVCHAMLQDSQALSPLIFSSVRVELLRAPLKSSLSLDAESSLPLSYSAEPA